VPAAQADVLYEAVIARQLSCTQPMNAASRRAYDLLASMTVAGPDRLLQNRDAANTRTPMREYAASFVDQLDACLARTSHPGAGWQAAAARLREAMRA
jgi:hypothetical protein